MLKVSVTASFEAPSPDISPVLRGRGKLIESDEIRFESVPIVTPNGDILVKSLSFYVKPGVRMVAFTLCHA